MPDRLVVPSAGKGYEPTRVDVRIAETDEPFVFAAVMPLQKPVREEGFQRAEQALEAANSRGRGGYGVACVIVLRRDVVLAFYGRREERCGRKLVQVPGYDHL